MWRSLVARFVRDEEVAGSNPVIPISTKANTEDLHNLSIVFRLPVCIVNNGVNIGYLKAFLAVKMVGNNLILF